MLERPLLGGPLVGYRAPNLLLRDWMIPILREHGFRYDASVCTVARRCWARTSATHTWRTTPTASASVSREPDPAGDLVEIPLPDLPVLRLPAATGILTRVAGVRWTTVALRHALRTGRRAVLLPPLRDGAAPATSRFACASGSSSAGWARGWRARSSASSGACGARARGS